MHSINGIENHSKSASFTDITILYPVRLSEKIQAIAEQKKDKAERRRRIEIFLHMMEEQKECLGFVPGMFVALVDKVIIQRDGDMEFQLKNGMKCAYP